MSRQVAGTSHDRECPAGVEQGRTLLVLNRSVVDRIHARREMGCPKARRASSKRQFADMRTENQLIIVTTVKVFLQALVPSMLARRN